MIAGRDIEHADAVARPLDREAARDGSDGSLGGAIGQAARHAELVEEGADIDDQAAARLARCG